MTVARLTFVAICVVSSSLTAFAFDQCDALPSPDQLARYISDTASLHAPVRFHELATSIKVVTPTSGETLIPYAIEQLGTKFIVFPPQFAAVACKIALAQALALEGTQPTLFEQGAVQAAKCFDAGMTQRVCLTAFANDMASRYRSAFLARSPREQSSSYGLYHSALNQLVMHEYGHHFLDHFARIKAQTLTRIDAEFEADLFAILNGSQSGEAPSSMFYFFGALARIEDHTKALTTNQYETGSCRASNVGNVTRFLG